MTEPSVGLNRSNWSSRRVNRLGTGLGARTYLEIGVSKGDTLRQIGIPDRVGVDPCFGFDISEMSNDRVALHERTSDAYFSSLPVSVVFDVIFIDGLHTFEQTYRDLCNALLHSNPRTVFLIDDTVPSNVFSSLPDLARCRKYRQMSGIQDGSWHGDVFKVIFAIHDFHPGLNYRTIMGSGNPQTLVWRSNSRVWEPRYNSFEAISRLTYFDLMDNIEIMRSGNEEEVITQCLAEVGQTAVPT